MKRFFYKNGINNYIYVIPFALFFITFLIYPIISNIYNSFFEWDGISPEKIWIGLQNYISMFKNNIFIISIKNNLTFLVLTVLIQGLIGFLLSIFMNRKLFGRNIYRSIVFIPAIIAPVIIGYTFGNMLNFTYGTLNEFFRNIGLKFLALDWIGNPKLAIYTIIFINIWEWTGFSVVLYLAGLQNIPQELYDAAKIDGANYFQTISKITFPMLTSTHFSLIILNSIGAIKIFDIVYVMTLGGPAHATEVLSTHIFLEDFTLNHTGYSSAVSVFMLAIALIITFFQLRLYRRVRIQ